ncbi:putative spermidine/putrescine transport system permease protein [Bradyrhizobium sp. USDA 4524]|uniref:ABC transporter permease subunit n=1 Tax=unclassified Bradyrhizobium TaxID=2631580 RepID=UPI00209D563E|nr:MULTISPECIES: ABC transporter permease subunit [unclassified Bradyrhizobium]MCP1845800.1 putative spermidine/putrescine transport system permease protein [Bradyrhizobium sp. USDA 4538]MCP1906877.1 putative spermidine/putrescine transport system permease protein [Bradyrhizobium sp. USDA 4537]MCP1985352.1 putative spermidine/putrescine transport system permease protein [Bradyrhizobium sp. USDA 4539]
MKRLALPLPGVALLAAGYALPMAIVVWMSLRHQGHWSTQAYAQIVRAPVFFGIFLKTLWMAFSVTGLCALLGYPYAYFVATRIRRYAAPIMMLVVIPYLTSVLIRSYSWIAILGSSGIVNRLLISIGLTSEPLPLVFSSFGSYVGMVHILLPMMILPLYGALRRLDPALIKAAQSLGGGPATVFWTVVFPLSRPGLAAGCALVFLCALGFYITPAMLGAPGDYLVAQAIEVRVSTLADFDFAAALACILFFGVSGFLVLFRRNVVPLGPAANDRWRSAGTGSGLRGAAWYRRTGIDQVAVALVDLCDAMAFLASPCLLILSALVLLFLLAPMIVVVMIAFSNAPYLVFPPPGFSTRWFNSLLGDQRWRDAAVFSFSMAVLSASTASLVGTAYSISVTRGALRARRIMWLAAIVPMILPQIVLGIGLFFLAVALNLNGTIVGFWLGFTVLGFPYVVIIMTAALQNSDIDVERAAVGLGATPMAAFLTVTLPLLIPALSSAFLFAFLAGFDDLVLSMFLSSPSKTPLAMLMWQDIHLEISPKTAVVGAFQLAALLAASMLLVILRKAKGTGEKIKMIRSRKSEDPRDTAASPAS